MFAIEEEAPRQSSKIERAMGLATTEKAISTGQAKAGNSREKEWWKRLSWRQVPLSTTHRLHVKNPIYFLHGGPNNDQVTPGYFHPLHVILLSFNPYLYALGKLRVRDEYKREI